MTEPTTALAPSERRSLVTRVAARFGVDADKMLTTLKDTAFKQPKRQGRDAPPISNEQMMALLVVADQYQLNPFTREIYAFPDRNGIVPIVGVDGWLRLMNSHPEFDGFDWRRPPRDEWIALHGAKLCPEWMEISIYRKDRSHPTVVTEYLDEVIRNVDGPWMSHTKRMLRHKTLIQGARVAFGFAGIFDEDEGHRIIDGDYSRDESGPAQAVARINQAVVETVEAPKAEDEPEPAPEVELDSPREVMEMLVAAKTADDFDLARAEASELSLSDDDAAKLQAQIEATAGKLKIAMEDAP